MGLVNIPSIDIAYGTSPFLNDKLSTDGPVSHGYGLVYQRIQAEVFPSADPEFLEFPTLLKLVTDDSGCLNPKFGLYVYIYILKEHRHWISQKRQNTKNTNMAIFKVLLLNLNPSFQ